MMKKTSWFSILVLFLCFIPICLAQDYDSPETPATPPPEQENCDGIFVTYTFMGREKEYPFVKNVSAQAWSFQAQATVLNAGANELKSWKMFIGFQHKELLVSTDGAVVVDGEGFPVKVGKNGTILAGYPQADLKTAIDTANDYSQMTVQVNIKGTQFGVSPKESPMPKTIKLVNEGYKCPATRKRGNYMHVCCKKDPKFKDNLKSKFSARRNGDLSFTYDVIQAYENRYLAQVTIDNNHPLGRLDQWNQDLDFSNVMNCQKKPIIADLPPEKENDDKVGKLPNCCKNGTLLPKTMNETKSQAIFQLQVFKLPPDLNRTSIYPPQNWKIVGRINPTYMCGSPIRVDPTVFPDPTGIQATTSAVASWQVTCNMTRPKPRETKCCVSYSAYYTDSVVPCTTCACGCDQNSKCDKNAAALSLPAEALLVPFANRTEKAKAWAKIKDKKLPQKLPCPDNCGVSINWHIDSDYNSGWTARITLFNWDDYPFADWFTAIRMGKAALGFEKAYSFNGTRPDRDPRIPGKQQSVLSFSKTRIQGLDVIHGDGFPSRVFFNGEECALPKELPVKSNAHRSPVILLPSILLCVLTFIITTLRIN